MSFVDVTPAMCNVAYLQWREMSGLKQYSFEQMERVSKDLMRTFAVMLMGSKE